MQQAEAAPLLTSAVNQSAFNLGNAGGAYVGAVMLEAGQPYVMLPWAAAFRQLDLFGQVMMGALIEMGLFVVILQAWQFGEERISHDEEAERSTAGNEAVRQIVP